MMLAEYWPIIAAVLTLGGGAIAFVVKEMRANSSPMSEVIAGFKDLRDAESAVLVQVRQELEAARKKGIITKAQCARCMDKLEDVLKAWEAVASALGEPDMADIVKLHDPLIKEIRNELIPKE